MDKQKILSMLDSTLLKADAKKEDIVKLCEDAKKYRFAAVCVHPCHVELCKSLLKGELPVATVVGFPMGANAPEVKAYEAADAVKRGADELDMVINIGAVRDGDYLKAEEDIRGVVKAAGGRIVKVIIETCYLTEQEKIQACLAAKRAGASFVKTSIGLAGGGATIEDVRLMKKTVGDALKVKAAGGIRSIEECEKFIKAGAERIGTGTAVKIAEGLISDGGY